MLKNDSWITAKSREGMITPFEGTIRNKREYAGALVSCISYGLSSYSYDIRLSAKEFFIFSGQDKGNVVNPKDFKKETLEPAKLHTDSFGEYFIIPANSYGLGVALERLEIPDNVLVVCLGKSTYARCGIIANITPVEPGWKGHLTLEFSNSSASDCKVYANEGIVALVFLEGDVCKKTYADRRGKYQDQQEHVTIAKMFSW